MGEHLFLEVRYILPALAPKILQLVDIIDCTVHFVISYEWLFMFYVFYTGFQGSLGFLLNKIEATSILRSLQLE